MNSQLYEVAYDAINYADDEIGSADGLDLEDGGMHLDQKLRYAFEIASSLEKRYDNFSMKTKESPSARIIHRPQTLHCRLDAAKAVKAVKTVKAMKALKAVKGVKADEDIYRSPPLSKTIQEYYSHQSNPDSLLISAEEKTANFFHRMAQKCIKGYKKYNQRIEFVSDFATNGDLPLSTGDLQSYMGYICRYIRKYSVNLTGEQNLVPKGDKIICNSHFDVSSGFLLLQDSDIRGLGRNQLLELFTELIKIVNNKYLEDMTVKKLHSPTMKCYSGYDQIKKMQGGPQESYSPISSPLPKTTMTPKIDIAQKMGEKQLRNYARIICDDFPLVGDARIGKNGGSNEGTRKCFLISQHRVSCVEFEGLCNYQNILPREKDTNTPTLHRSEISLQV